MWSWDAGSAEEEGIVVAQVLAVHETRSSLSRPSRPQLGVQLQQRDATHRLLMRERSQAAGPGGFGVQIRQQQMKR